MRPGIRPAPPERVLTHTVMPGETWQSIAAEYYRDGDRGAELARYNGAEPTEELRPGSGVRVPLGRGDLSALDKVLRAAAAYNEGLECAQTGDYPTAIERFGAALKDDPALHDAAYNLAVTYRRIGRHEESLAMLEDLVRRERGNAGYHFALGHARYHAGDYRRAAESFNEALRIDPGHLEALFSLASAYERGGQREQALRAWRRYLELDPRGDWADRAREHLRALEGKAQ